MTSVLCAGLYWRIDVCCRVYVLVVRTVVRTIRLREHKDVSRRGMGSRGFLAKRPGLRVYLAYIKDDPCAYCGGPGGTVEHIVPQSSPVWKVGKGCKGYTGPHHWSNVAMSCRSCNSRKGGKGLLLWLVQAYNGRTGAWKRKPRLDITPVAISVPGAS